MLSTRVSGLEFVADRVVFSINNFVELTSIKPDASAFRAVVYLDALSLGHLEIAVVYWAFHSGVVIKG